MLEPLNCDWNVKGLACWDHLWELHCLKVEKRSWQMVRSKDWLFELGHNVFMKLEEEIRLMFLTNRRSWKQKGVCSCWIWINIMHQHTWLVYIWDSPALPKIATSEIFGVPFSSWHFGKFKVTYWRIAGNFYVSQYKRIFKNYVLKTFRIFNLLNCN